MAEKVNGCRAGATYVKVFFSDSAAACAAQLTRETKHPHGTACHTENIGDGMPAHVWVTYCKVIEGRGTK